MARLAAFVTFLLAAFNVGLPGVDRTGEVALALALLCVAVGRRREGRLPSIPRRMREPVTLDLTAKAVTPRGLGDRIADYLETPE